MELSWTFHKSSNYLKSFYIRVVEIHAQYTCTKVIESNDMHHVTKFIIEIIALYFLIWLYEHEKGIRGICPIVRERERES